MSVGTLLLLPRAFVTYECWCHGAYGCTWKRVSSEAIGRARLNQVESLGSRTNEGSSAPSADGKSNPR